MKLAPNSKAATVAKNSPSFFPTKSKQGFFGHSENDRGFFPAIGNTSLEQETQEFDPAFDEEQADVTAKFFQEEDSNQTAGAYIEEKESVDAFAEQSYTALPTVTETEGDEIETIPVQEEAIEDPVALPVEEKNEETPSTTDETLSIPEMPSAIIPAPIITDTPEEQEQQEASTDKKETGEDHEKEVPVQDKKDELSASLPKELTEETILPETEQQNDAAIEKKNEKEKEEVVANEENEKGKIENPVMAEESPTGEAQPAADSAPPVIPAGETAEAAALDGTDSDALLKSWTSAPPVSFIQNSIKVNELAATAQQEEKGELKESFPVIEQPTGVPVKNDAGESANIQPVIPEEKQAPDLQPQGAAVVIPKPEPVTISKIPVNNVPIPKGLDEKPAEQEDEGSWWDRLSGKISSFTSKLKTTDESVDTDPGAAPKVPLEGESDPGQNEQHTEEANQNVDTEKTNSDQASQEYFGENDVYPEIEPVMMTPSVEPVAPQAPGQIEQKELLPIDPQVAASFNIEAQAKMDEQVGGEMAKHEEGRQKMETDSLLEREKTESDIDSETSKTKDEQESMQQQAKDDVDGYRTEWKDENEKVKAEYSDKSEAKRNEIDEEIDTKVTETDTQVTEKYDEANQKAEAEKVKAEQEAERKKQEEENKPKSWWQKFKDGVSAAFDAIKDALNTIFNALRSLVKGIIDAVKSVVVGLIDLARKAIVGLIKAFGEALKAFVSFALAAFPELAKKFNDIIDKAVNVAVEAVNQLADALKAAVEFLLDALASVLDAILGAFQALYNALLDVLHFLVVGLMKILEGIANLVSAAYNMPDHFWGQVSEEMLGTDITKPLPNERPMPGNTQQVAETKVESGEITQQEADLVQKSELQPHDVEVDEVPTDFTLEPELMGQLSMMPEENEQVIDTPGEGGEEAVESTKEEALTGQPAVESKTSATEDAESSVPAAAEQTATTETAVTGNEEGQEMVGPFSGPAERLAHIAGQMKEAIVKWWDENKVAIIAALVLGLAGLILANFLTGGAIFAAIPLVLELLSLWFAAKAIGNATKYFGTFLQEGFAGNVMAGAVALARASAIIIIEIVTSLLFAGKAAIKGLKTATKTVAKQGVKGALKTGAKAAKTAAVNSLKKGVTTVGKLWNVGKAGGKALLKKGKLVIKGVRNGFAKGAKSFGSFAKRLANKLKLKRIKIVRRKWRFFIYGEFNPWVLLATGEIKEVKSAGGKRVGGAGKFITKEGEAVEGILVGVKGEGLENASTFVKSLAGNPELAAGVNRVASKLAEKVSKEAAERLVKGLSNLRNKANVAGILSTVEKLSAIPGIDKVLKDLAAGGKRLMGAEFVLEYLTKNKALLEGLTELEMKGVGRIYDAFIDGVRYEFKNWEEMIPHAFLKQFLKDVNLRQEFRWVFSGRMKDPNLLKKVGELLKKSPDLNLTPGELEALLKKLGSIIIVDK